MTPVGRRETRKQAFFIEKILGLTISKKVEGTRSFLEYYSAVKGWTDAGASHLHGNTGLQLNLCSLLRIPDTPEPGAHVNRNVFQMQCATIVRIEDTFIKAR